MTQGADPIISGKPQTPPGALAGRLAEGTLIPSVCQVLAPIGEDLLGAVYRARRIRRPDEGPGPGPGNDQEVRLIVLRREINPGGAAQDVALVSRMEHKNLLPVYALVQHGGQAMLLDDLPAGQSLRQMIDKKRRSQGQPLSAKGAYNIIAGVCNLLTYAHGVLPHGALCPEAIDITLNGQVRVGRLGVGRSVPAALLAADPGCASCLAPERRPSQAQALGGPASPAADIYTVGALLLECLTGRLASEEDAAALRPSQLNPELPAAVDEVIARCLQQDPALRFTSPQELKEALADALAGGPKATSSQPLMAFRPGMAQQSPKVSTQMPAVLPPQPMSGVAEMPLAQGQPNQTSRAPRPPAGVGQQATTMAQIKGPPSLLPPPPLASGSRPSVPGPSAPPGAPGSPGTIDENHDRWLITKEDRLDYGPFPLREVKSQIEKGTISADHQILDTETGDRRRVREHPLLAELAREWEARHAQSAMELRDHSERARHRASVQKMLAAILAAVVVIGVGIAGYFKFIYKPPEKVVVVQKDSGDDFWKGVDIQMKVDAPPPRKKGVKKRVLKNGKWEEVTSMGDASEEGGDETLSAAQINDVMKQNFRVLGGCLKEEAGRNPSVRKLDMEFQIKGSGNVSAVRVNGESGSVVASCVFAKMQAVTFPRFNGSKTTATFSLGLK